MVVELPLQDLVREVDAQLLEAIGGHDLEAEDVQDADVRRLSATLLAVVLRQGRTAASG